MGDEVRVVGYRVVDGGVGGFGGFVTWEEGFQRFRGAC